MDAGAAKRRTVLTEPQAYRLLENHGIKVAPWRVARNPSQAGSVAAKLGFPVVAKVVSRDVVHKSDSGGVMSHLHDASEVKEAYNSVVENVRSALPNAVIDGILVQEMVSDTIELIVGVVRNAQFGRVILFGSGGIFVEFLDDIAMRILPIDTSDARQMIQETRVSKLLLGVRGKPPCDIQKIVDLLLKVSRFTLEQNEMLELDLNPVLINHEGIWVADARIVRET